MSAMPARVPAAPPASSPARSWRPRLHVVRTPAPGRSLAPYLLLCATILLGALVGALLLNTQMAVTAYEIHDSRRELNRLVEGEASLRQQVEVAGSPAELERRATGLGMVPAETVGFVDLGEGTIVGLEDGE